MIYKIQLLTILSDLGNVKFSPRAFVDPYTYTYGQETTSDLKAYEDYFTGRNDTNPGFRVSIKISKTKMGKLNVVQNVQNY